MRIDEDLYLIVEDGDIRSHRSGDFYLRRTNALKYWWQTANYWLTWIKRRNPERFAEIFPKLRVYRVRIEILEDITPEEVEND